MTRAVHRTHTHARGDLVAGPFDPEAGSTRAGSGVLSALDEYRRANPWRARGRCVTDPPPPGASWWAVEEPAAAALAVHTCTSCPVWRECLAHALTTPERYGVWGATVPGNRWTGRAGMRRRLVAGVPLAQLLDEHERRLDPDDDELAPAVVLALRASRGHSHEHTRELLAALGREVPPVPVVVNRRGRRRVPARTRVEASVVSRRLVSN